MRIIAITILTLALFSSPASAFKTIEEKMTYHKNVSSFMSDYFDSLNHCETDNDCIIYKSWCVVDFINKENYKYREHLSNFYTSRTALGCPKLPEKPSGVFCEKNKCVGTKTENKND